ncbi:MAG TPA: sigma-70 family RNA polymerase sigma factor [Bacillales bacterium]|nr:sigma-70 family RNA polymerase sigma factor [Bacillales bacterium]
MTEERLIELAREGDLQAFDDLMKIYYPVVERFGFQLGNPADMVDDITQEVFFRVYRYLHQYSHGKFSTWLYQITLNVTRDLYRKRKSVWEKWNMLKQQPEGPRESTESFILEDERDRELHMLIQSLDDRYKLPIVLFYFHEKKLDEIAEILDLSLNTVKTRLSRGRERLKNALEKGGSEDANGFL